MQQKQVILLVVVLIVVVIAIVAAVLLMGGNKGTQTTTYPGATGNPGTPGTPITNPTGGTNPPTGGTTPPAGGTPSTGGGTVNANLVNAIAAGSPVECDVSMTVNSTTVNANLKIKYPKFKESATVMGMQVTIISDGTNGYMNSASMGNVWYKTAITQGAASEITPDKIKQSLQNLPAGMTINCRAGTFSDADISLPANAQVQDMAALAGAYGAGAGGSPSY